MAQYKFVTPSVQETPAGWNRLFMRYGIHRGISVLKVNGIYSPYRYPAQTEIAEAEEVYLGGHQYIIDETTKDNLTNPAIGGVYGDYITPL